MGGVVWEIQFFKTVETMAQRLDFVKAYIPFLLYNGIPLKEGLDKKCNSIFSATIIENLANILVFLIKQSIRKAVSILQI